MITTKDILEEYITADAKANGVKLFGIKNKLKNRFNPIWQFLVALRRYEYTRNHCKRNILTMLIFLLRWKRYHRLSVKLGFSIPPNVCNRGLSLPHYGNIVINPACKIRKNCRIHVGVNMGANGGSNGAPDIGDNVYIAPGAKLYGNISIGSNCFIAANSVVNRDFNDNSVIAGMPAILKKHIDRCWWQQHQLKLD